MKRLYVVKDVPKYSEGYLNYCYVVKAETEIEAINIDKQKLSTVGIGKLH